MSFCDPATVDDWLICPGKLTLEESEEPVEPTGADKDFQQAVRTSFQAPHDPNVRITALIPATVDVSLITGESGSHDLVDALVVIEEKPGKTRLSVYDSRVRRGKMKLDALAGYLQHSLLYDITEITLGDASAITLDQLYLFGQQVTEAASIAMAIRGEATFTAHLNPGRQCLRCRSAYRCPAYQALV